MPLMLVYDPDKTESSMIRNQLGYIDNASENISFYEVQSLKDLMGLINSIDDVSLYCSDFEAGGENAIKVVRELHPSVFVVVIVGQNTSPRKYVRPSIMASGLLLRPFSSDQVTIVLREVLEAFWLKEKERLFNNEVFSFSTREGITRIPFSKILYFEARSKKIVVCTSRSEMEFYSTLDGLKESLPTYFLRCHKGFIINSLLINRIDLNQNLIHLFGSFKIPISRSYRTSIVEALK